MERRRGFGVPRAGWQSGYAADCKSVHAGSIPAPASSALRAARAIAGAGGRCYKGAAPDR